MIDFTAKLFGLSVKETALKLAADFGVSYDARGHGPPVKKPVKPKIRDTLLTGTEKEKTAVLRRIKSIA